MSIVHDHNPLRAGCMELHMVRHPPACLVASPAGTMTSETELQWQHKIPNLESPRLTLSALKQLWTRLCKVL